MASSSAIAAWLRERSVKHLELLGKMQDRLLDGMPSKSGAGTDGEQRIAWKAWCRVYALYQAGFQSLRNEQFEAYKITLLTAKSGAAPLSYEDYQRELAELGADAVKALSDDAIRAEAARRGIELPDEAALLQLQKP